MDFGNRLANFRKLHGLNQETLAERVGVSRQAVSKWETGEAQPDFAKLIALADALEVSLDELCGRTTGTAVQMEASSQAPAPKNQGAKIIAIVVGVLLFCLAICMGAFLLFGRTDSVQEDSTAIFSAPITASNIAFSRKNDGVQYSFSVSVVDESCAYGVCFVNGDGTVEASVPQLTNGVFHGTAKLSSYEVYRMNVIITKGKQHRVIPVLYNLSFADNGYSYNEVA